MARSKKAPLTLARLRPGTLFKVLRPHREILALEGVYVVATAKADGSKNVVVYDLAGLRKVDDKMFRYGSLLTIPAKDAQQIEVYLPPIRSN